MPAELEQIQYEIFRHRLFNILEEGRIAMKMVSGSPVVVEGGETMCCVCKADGTPILIAAGILLHAIGASDFIAKAIELYEDDPGFFEGDQLFFNDPYIGGQHLIDQVIIMPVFHGGQRVAWVGSIMHTPDIGGLEAAGSPARATEIFHEGTRFLGLKIMENGRLRRDVYNTILQQARDPHFLALDTRAKIAANNTCARGYQQLIGKFGLEFVQRAGDKLIEESAQLARSKLRRLPDGVWRSRLYGDNTGGEKDAAYRVVCTMTKKGETLTFDFTGTSPQNPGALNCTLPATWGQLFVPLSSQLFWDVPTNKGIFAPIKVIAPEGTLVNCKFPAAVSRGVSTVGLCIQETAHECIAKMQYAGGIHEDINASWRGPTGGSPSFGGVNQYDELCAGSILDTFGCGLGATPYRDGVDTGGNMMNPQSCISDVEILEMNIPFMYLSRRQATDSGGFGKYAGGMAPEMVYMIYGGKNLKVSSYRHSRRTPSNWGIFGGYPGAVNDALFVLDSNVKDWFRNSRTPTQLSEAGLLGGEVLDPLVPNIPMRLVNNFELLFCRLGAGGGYGDPLDRDPETVLADFKRKAVSRETAEQVYGVVIDPEAVTVNRKRTEEKRREILARRLREGRRLEGPWLKEALAPSGEAAGPGPELVSGSGVSGPLRVHEYLDIVDIGGRKFTRCHRCRRVLGPASENYKLFALLRETDLADVNLRSPVSGEKVWVVYQEYICPGCGVLFQVDNFCPMTDAESERVLWDIQVKA